MAKRHGERIRGVFLRRLRQLQALGHDLLNLGLLGAAGPARSLLDLLGRVLPHIEAGARQDQQGDAAGVPQDQRASGVAVLEDPLHRRGVRPMGLEHRPEQVEERPQAMREGFGLVEDQHPIVDVDELHALDVDDAPTAKPGARVDADDPSPSARRGGRRRCGGDTGGQGHGLGIAVRGAAVKGVSVDRNQGTPQDARVFEVIRNRFWVRVLTLLGVLGACGPTTPTVTMSTVPAPRSLAPAPASWAVGGARAFRATREDELLRGPAALGVPGDFVLRNERLVAVVRAPENPGPLSGRGGGIVDLSPAGGLDAFGELAPVFDADARLFPVVREVAVAQDGRQGGPAILRMSGVDARDEDLRVEVDYVLAPDADFIRITTTVTHRGRAHYRDHVFGHGIAWGALRPFVPDLGEPSPGARSRTTWIGGDGEQSAAALTSEGGLIEAVHGRDFSQTVERQGYVAPNTTITHTVSLYVGGNGGIAGVAGGLAADRGTVTGRVEGLVTERRKQKPVSGAWIVFKSTRTQATVTRARAGRDGRFSAQVEPGHYTLTAWAQGRALSPPSRVDVGADALAQAHLVLEPPGRVKYTLRDPLGAVLPGRLSFTGLAGTTTPWLGPPGGSPYAGNQVFALADGTTRVPPGRYRVVVSAGPAFEFAALDVDVRAGETSPVALTLRRAIDPGPYIAVDPLTRTLQGPGSGVSPDARLAACRVEGVDWLVAADALGGPQWSRTTTRPVPGMLATGGLLLGGADGRFAVLPMVNVPRLPTPLAERAIDLLPWMRTLPGRPLVAVLRPRAGDSGFFARFGWDSAAAELPRGGFSLDFDLMQVLGPTAAPGEEDAILRDYYALMSRGAAVVPLGASGSAETAREWCGRPRTWLRGPVRDAAGLEAALRRGDVVVSNGPMLSLEVEGIGPGGTVPGPSAGRIARVRVQAASWASPEWLEWVENGVVAEQTVLPGSAKEPLDATFERTLGPNVEWLAVHVRGDADLAPVYPPGAGASRVRALTHRIRFSTAPVTPSPSSGVQSRDPNVTSP